jgi:hypothetical protein
LRLTLDPAPECLELLLDSGDLEDAV